MLEGEAKQLPDRSTLPMLLPIGKLAQCCHACSPPSKAASQAAPSGREMEAGSASTMAELQRQAMQFRGEGG